MSAIGLETDFFHLTGKSAYLPGGYGDLGKSIAWNLARRGIRVAVSGRSLEKGEALAAEMREQGHEAAAFAVDVKSVAEIRDAADGVVERFGGIDYLINCVGIQREELLLDVTEEAYDEVYQSNLKSAMFVAQAVARHQIQAGKRAKQVHLLSVRSRLALRGRGYSAYCSTKGGLLMLVRQHAMELAPYLINVNGVAPTFVETEMFQPLKKNQAFLEKALARNPLGYIADPEDVAGPTLFLCSPASDYITGQVLFVDGGITCSQ